MEKEIDKLILKLQHLINITDSEEARAAYRYTINELRLIQDGKS
jgi:hypothetical protein